ncbi:ABC transporter permease [Rhodophyticola sp.]|uniref:ABC transporter permease n=1 Tax=Rhodophyticola sp. TaxID=2680032 RepID=UPI003D2AC0EC
MAALILREMSVTYGRSPGGYIWAVLEPAAGIGLLVLVFSVAFEAPPMGSNFAMFYATGMIPFLAYSGDEGAAGDQLFETTAGLSAGDLRRRTAGAVRPQCADTVGGRRADLHLRADDIRNPDGAADRHASECLCHVGGAGIRDRRSELPDGVAPRAVADRLVGAHPATYTDFRCYLPA